jgi:hypothetical protein
MSRSEPQHRPTASELAEVRDAAGHSNVAVTSAYLHVGVEENRGAGRLFEFETYA